MRFVVRWRDEVPGGCHRSWQGAGAPEPGNGWSPGFVPVGSRPVPVSPRQPFLRLGPEGSFYSKWLWACPRPIRVGDELWFYYAGSNRDHGRRAGPSDHKPQAALTRAILRLDGFVSADAAYSGGTLTTPPIIFQGSCLELNLDTSAGGSARVEIQDASGKPLAGYGSAEADELNGNSVNMRVSWRGSADVSALSGKPVKLHFKLRSCKRYAFQFVN